MTPIEFPEVNTVYAKDQPEYQPLPAFKSSMPNGEVVTCWKLSFRERLRILFKGEIWLSMLTFNKPLTPSFMTTKKRDVLVVEEFDLEKAKQALKNIADKEGGVKM